MKTSIEKLEKHKREELIQILEVILNIWKNYIKPEYIIIFWDYIKNNKNIINLVREWDTLVEYKTIIQILVITRKPAQEKNMTLSREIMSKIKNIKEIKSAVNIIIQDIYSFNDWIEQKMYFYLNILNEWIMLYNSGRFKLKQAKSIWIEEIKQIQKDDFGHMYEIACEFIKDYKNAYNRASYKLSLFYLHQSVEFLLTCYLLVKVWYKPKTHDIDILYTKIKEQTKEFNYWFDLKNENYYFEILRWAYINSRYNKDYVVNRQDILFLEIKVLSLRELVRKECIKLIK